MKASEEQKLEARRLLPGPEEIERALGAGVRVEPVAEQGSIQNIEAIAAAAAEQVAYRSFRGELLKEEGNRPVAVGEMALIFDRASKAERTFAQIGEASHLRLPLGESKVAVETVTAAKGLVSYWGYVQRGPVLVVLTLDTLDPQQVSMTSFRALVTLAVEKLSVAS